MDERYRTEPADAPRSVGGHPALDFVNTVAWRRDVSRRADRISDCSALVEWTVSNGVLDAEQAGALQSELGRTHAEDVLERALTFREVLHRVLQPVAAAESPDPDEVEALRRAMTSALSRAEVVSLVPLQWAVQVRDLSDLPAALVLCGWRLLQFEDLTRLRECADSGCGWLFLDRSKNASRRWCSSGDCGNRARVRRHYRRSENADARGAARRGQR
jgi:predicted RNA-binding Zn ribbon-like protein